MPRSKTIRLICFLTLGLATNVGAQDAPPEEAPGLGPAYAQLIQLTAAPDFSASRLFQPGSRTDITRLPYDRQLTAFSPVTSLHGRLAFSYSKTRGLVDLAESAGRIDTQWIAPTIQGGLFFKHRLDERWTIEPGLDFAVTRLRNKATYEGPIGEVRGELDGRLFNWRADSQLISPNLAIHWRTIVANDHRLHLAGRVGVAWIKSFNESSPEVSFNERSSSYSVFASYTIPSGHALWSRPVDYVLFARHAGFLGANRRELGFSALNETGAAVEFPLRLFSDIQQSKPSLRIGASYLFGPQVHGWGLTLGLNF